MSKAREILQASSLALRIFRFLDERLHSCKENSTIEIVLYWFSDDVDTDSDASSSHRSLTSQEINVLKDSSTLLPISQQLASQHLPFTIL
jgi:hypothetical protein